MRTLRVRETREACNTQHGGRLQLTPSVLTLRCCGPEGLGMLRKEGEARCQGVVPEDVHSPHSSTTG